MLWKGFQRPKRLDFERETLTDRFGRFYAQPFERGFGTTVGNALRRVLLSSIEGAAITAVQIDGVLHEFSPIKGVVEDVKGKTKEAVGTVTGRDDMIREGKAQQDKADAQQDAAKKEAEADSARAGAKAAEKRQENEQRS